MFGLCVLELIGWYGDFVECVVFYLNCFIYDVFFLERGKVVCCCVVLGVIRCIVR